MESLLNTKEIRNVDVVTALGGTARLGRQALTTAERLPHGFYASFTVVM
jgi:hypothetical protein